MDLLVATAADRSIPLARPDLGITEPAPLRRADGSSVYTVAGADLYTSARVVAAEHQLVELAGLTDGRRAAPAHVAAALEASAADGRELNVGQVELVTAMATSGARLQLAIAPAGAGKTTAMQALDRRLDRRWRRRAGARALGGGGRATARPDRHHHRNPRQTRLAHHPPRPPRVGCRGGPTDAGGDRRSRDGRHAEPRPRRLVGGRAGRVGPPDR